MNLDVAKSLKATELANVDHTYNESLEKMLTQIHNISKTQVFILILCHVLFNFFLLTCLFLMVAKSLAKLL